MTAGGDKLDCKDNAGSPAANLLETKILLNIVMSDAHEGVWFMSANAKDYFLATLIDELECIRVCYKNTPQDIRDRYHLDSKVTKDGWLCIIM